ncbi:MAG TPA: CxxxxCH/CxxCH domain-containing protein, partial [Geobacteraceae bacterium]|nr:CxxxxCH/CxxCH domain-containing protein [Geobacteraceae bacterium]
MRFLRYSLALFPFLLGAAVISGTLFHAPLFAEASLQCYGCHGTGSTMDIRPVDRGYRNVSSGGFVGNHRTHLAQGAVPARCEVCHPGAANYSSAHRDGRIRLSVQINGSQLITPYNNRTTAWQQTATPALGSCNNVNCHFEVTTPVWGSSPASLTCSSCHNSPPADGSHGKKHGDYFGSGTGSCAKCHSNHLAESNVFAHATGAGRRGIRVQFTSAPNSGGTYSGGTTDYPNYLPRLSPARNGSCSDIYCHSDGRGGPPVKQLTWSDSKTTDCFTCHRGRTVDSTPDNCAGFGVWSTSREFCTPDLTMSSNGHHRLVGPQWIRKYACYYCHNGTVDAAGNLVDLTRHVNGEKNVAI